MRNNVKSRWDEDDTIKFGLEPEFVTRNLGTIWYPKVEQFLDQLCRVSVRICGNFCGLIEGSKCGFLTYGLADWY